MVAPFDVSQLYEAVVDDDYFAEMPNLLAGHFGARSAVIHWLDGKGQSTVDAHSRYFTPEQFDLYTQSYAQHDVWTQAALGPARRNKAWNVADLVSANQLESSIFYNEWIRALGDDTYHCIGAVMETAHGFGIIGMHRGRAQGDFGSRQLGALDATLNHLRRAITIRSALVSRTREVAGWQQIFASSSAPTLILDRTGFMRQANTAGEALLSSATLLESRGGQIVPRHAQQESAFRHLLLRATDPALPEACQGAFGSAPSGMWIAEFLPLVGGHLAGCAMLTVIDRAAGRQRGDVPALLREVHGLTRAEAEVACALGEGLGIDEIAARRGSAVDTVRAQLKQIMAKTGTRKQSEVVALVLRLTLL